MENCFDEEAEEAEGGIVKKHLPSVKMIFKVIEAHLSDLNEKTIGCLVPMILRSENP